MVVMFLLELIGSAVGLYNLSKGVYNMYNDAENYKKQQEEYKKYIELQKQRPETYLLTESQYQCFSDGFEII